jgi:hypothetical protein
MAIVLELHRSSSALASPELKWLAARIFLSRMVFWVHYGWQLLSPSLAIPAAWVHATFRGSDSRQSFIKNLFVKNLFFYSLSVLQRNKGQLLQVAARFLLALIKDYVLNLLVSRLTGYW